MLDQATGNQLHTFDELITHILARFACGSGPEVESLVQETLRDVAEFVGVDYALVVRASDDLATWSVASEWCSPGAPSRMAAHQDVPMGTWGWNENVLLEGQVLCVNRMDDLPPEASASRQRMEGLGFKSTLQVPMRRPGGEISGCVALCSLSREISWDDEDIQRLRLVGEAIANAMQRARVECELRQSEERLREALAKVRSLTVQLQAENTYLQEEISNSLGSGEIVGRSDAIRAVLRNVDHVAKTDASVLLLGETGTGKELLARAIHERSRRCHRPLVKVNLAAIPSSLIESELFGHVKGAFTGAVNHKIGRFQLANGGTLFLDEIGELTLDLQTRLLRVLQEGEFEAVGSSQTSKVDVRIVAATNRHLRKAVEHGEFRADLYYRLAVFPIDIPPLRLRRDDIPLLVWHFVSKKRGRLGKAIESIPAGVMARLVEYSWPGNVRELENVIERAMILSSGPTLTLSDGLLDSHLNERRESLVRSRIEMEQASILAALEACCWKVKGAGNAAEKLGLKPSTLRYRMKILGIERPKKPR